MMPLFEKLFPGAVGEFIFDQSTAHGAFADDALHAPSMNVNPGGKQRLMHATTIPENNPHTDLRGKPQSMVYPDDHADPGLRGKAKGMRAVLEERGLWADLVAASPNGRPVGDCKWCKLSQKERERQERLEAIAMAGADDDDDGGEIPDISAAETSAASLGPNPNPTKCCMRKMISLQSDFKNEKPLLQKVIEERGHKCIFLPKFHCELNPIEMYWGWVKIRAFRRNFRVRILMFAHVGYRLPLARRWNVENGAAARA